MLNVPSGSCLHDEIDLVAAVIYHKPAVATGEWKAVPAVEAI
jgi:hypothetical protein